MPKLIITFVIALVIGFGAGYITRPAEVATVKDTESAHMENKGAHTHTATIELAPTSQPPSLTVTATPDPKSGFNVRIQPKNFRFSPEHASTDHILGEGHAHIYVDSKKISRVYSEWFHIDKLSPGEHKIRVTLNANSHEELSVNGNIIEKSVIVTVSPEGDAMMVEETNDHMSEDGHMDDDHSHE